MSEGDISALWLTIRLASVTTIVLLVIGTPLAWWLSRTRWRLSVLVEALVAVPLVLPPTVLGFYLLVLLGPKGMIGSFVESLGGVAPVFSFGGLVIGSVLYSLPFVVQPLQTAFRSLDESVMEAGASLGASPFTRFFRIALPLSRRGLITAAVLGFAHTVGEFGVVLMIGGSIPEETRVASIAIYDHVEALDYGSAHTLSAILLGFSFCVLVVVFSVYQRGRR